MSRRRPEKKRPFPDGPRRRPGRRRERPGRPPPRQHCRRRDGFSGPGFRQCFDVLVPFEGRVKREYFNDLSRRIVHVCTGVGAIGGLLESGDWPWAVAGGLAALLFSYWFVRYERLYRP